ncbi:MAG: signal recognition particle-docking protein FtsY [Deltaproteobacteria bacterium]|nr:signal recognition particle-docking protein FtsY [Deltaproteobacteria bacterium]
MGIADRLKARLARTHNAIMGGLESVLGKQSRKESLEALEEALIMADVGVKTSAEIADRLKDGFSGFWQREDLRDRLREEVLTILKDVESPLAVPSGQAPFVIMVLGVNGVGKTTTIGKLASRFVSEGRSVVLGAGDTFRAAAIEQLEVWGKRTGCPVIKHLHGGDPGAVAFDAVKSAMAKTTDVVILDTAGRLHTKVNLMEELKKITRVIKREIPLAPHENLLVVDASTGQNALNQVKLFNEAAGVTGIAVTKLDGTAKGGIIVPIAREFRIPIRFIGVGEGVDDLKEFNAREFAEALI